jgi:plastocyanin
MGVATGIKVGVALAAVAGALALAGCGDDDDDETTASPTETATETTDSGGGGGGGETVAVTETDFAIDPANPTVQAGTVTFEVTNDGAAPHNLEVEGQGVEAVLDQDLAAGESGTLEVDLEPGTYEWYCPVGDHAAQGMEGELTVE